MNGHPWRRHVARVAPMLALPILALLAPLPLDLHAWREAHAAARPRRPSSKATKGFSDTVSDCHEPGTLDSIRLEVSEGSVSFAQILTMNCIAATRPTTVKLVHARKGRELEVSIVLRSDVFSDCTCPVGIEGTIANLAPGEYRIAFVFDHPPGDSPNAKPIRQTLATKELTLK